MSISTYGSTGGPEKMARIKGHRDALAGRQSNPSDAWSVHLRKIYRESYDKTKEAKEKHGEGSVSR